MAADGARADAPRRDGGGRDRTRLKKTGPHLPCRLARSRDSERRENRGGDIGWSEALFRTRAREGAGEAEDSSLFAPASIEEDDDEIDPFAPGRVVEERADLPRFRGHRLCQGHAVRGAAPGIGERRAENVESGEIEEGEPGPLPREGVEKDGEREIVESRGIGHEAIPRPRRRRRPGRPCRGTGDRLRRPSFPRERAPRAGGEEEVVREDRPASVAGRIGRPPVHDERRDAGTPGDFPCRRHSSRRRRHRLATRHADRREDPAEKEGRDARPGRNGEPTPAIRTRSSAPMPWRDAFSPVATVVQNAAGIPIRLDVARPRRAERGGESLPFAEIPVRPAVDPDDDDPSGVRLDDERAGGRALRPRNPEKRPRGEGDEGQGEPCEAEPPGAAEGGPARRQERREGHAAGGPNRDEDGERERHEDRRRRQRPRGAKRRDRGRDRADSGHDSESRRDLPGHPFRIRPSTDPEKGRADEDENDHGGHTDRARGDPEKEDGRVAEWKRRRDGVDDRLDESEGEREEERAHGRSEEEALRP